jgi:hypothetical protein
MRWLCVAAFAFLSVHARAQLVLHVNDAAPRTVSSAAFAKLPRQAATLNDHGKEVHYEGPAIAAVLALAGIDLTKELRGNQLSTYLSAVATDDYQVVFSLGDFDPSITDSGAIIADKREGEPLSAKEGPLRLILPHDKRPTRSIRMLKEIDVVQLRK